MKLKNLKLKILGSSTNTIQKNKAGVMEPEGTFANVLGARMMGVIKSLFWAQKPTSNADSGEDDDDTTTGTTEGNKSSETAELEKEELWAQGDLNSQSESYSFDLQKQLNLDVSRSQEVSSISDNQVDLATNLQPIVELQAEVSAAKENQTQAKMKVDPLQQSVYQSDLKQRLDGFAPLSVEPPSQPIVIPPIAEQIDPALLDRVDSHPSDFESVEKTLPLKFVAETTWVANQDPVEGLYHYAVREVQRVTNIKPEHPKFGGVVAAKLIHEVGKNKAASALVKCHPKINSVQLQKYMKVTVPGVTKECEFQVNDRLI
jgi:hypothetical protein